MMHRRNRFFYYCFCTVVVSLTLSCAAPDRVPDAAPAPPPSPLPKAEPLNTLLPQDLVAEEPREPVERFNLRLRDGDLQDLLLSFSKTTPYNFIVAPDVQGTVTVELKDVTLEEALDSILAPQKFAYRQEGRFINVFRERIETRIFPINYVNTIRTGTTEVFSGSQGGGGVTSGGGGGTGGGAGGGGISSGGGISGGFSTISSTDTADPFLDLEEGIKSVLSGEGTVNINRTASTIVVTDFPSHLNAAEKYIKLVEQSIQRQVLIQATIVEVSLSDEFEFGIDWAALSQISDLGGTITALGDSNRVVSQTLNTGGSVFQLGLASGDLSAILSAFSRQGKVNVVSKPRVSALNNQRALIRVGKNDVFFTISRIPARVAGELEQITTTPTGVFLGLSLAVTAQIGTDGMITMTILPTQSDLSGQAVSRFGDTVPILSIREAQTVVRMRDGQTIVMAGLIEEKVRDDTIKVPILGSIPFLGQLFTQTIEKKEKTELVIFLTPTILTSQNIGTMAQETQRSIKKLSSQ